MTVDGATSTLTATTSLEPPPAATTLAPPTAGEPTAAAPTAPRRRWAGRPSRYAVAATALVGLYLLAWLGHFPYVYGWIMDDRTDFLKGLDTIHDWRAAFAYYDALQPYFYLISYVPLASGLSLPSYPLPTFGEHTGQFRFFLLTALLLHTGLLLIWAWFATRVVRSRLVAWLSLLLLATSPTYTLWSPQPESRLLGMPFALPGLWLLLRSDGLRGSKRAIVGWPLLAGSLFGVAQSIHYTSLYLIVPVSVAIWGVRLVRGWRQRAYWLGLAGFVLGCAWLQALVEVVSDFIIGIPWQGGPTATLLELRNIHSSHWSFVGNLQLWQEWFLTQLGLPLLIAVAVGWVLFLRTAPGPGAAQRQAHLELGLGLALALVYLGLSGSMALFRQTSVLQPFLFLFAGLALVDIGRWLSRRRLAGQVAISGALLLGVGLIPWQQAYAVFRGHEGLGRALEWAYANKGDRPLAWLKIAWYGDTGSVATQAELAALPSNAWVMTYFPWQFVSDRPSLLPAIQDTPPLGAWDTLWMTDTIYAEMQAYWPNWDWRVHPVMSQARVYAAADLLQHMQGPPLPVASVTADSAASPEMEPLNVFDHDGSPDHHTAWTSADTPMPHWIAFQLAQPTLVGDIRIVEPTTPNASITRIDSLEVQAADAQGTYQTVWQQDGLQRLPVIAAHWQPTLTTGLRVVVRREVFPWGPSNQAGIEEITLPPYTVVAPAPTRNFPQLTLRSIVPSDGGLLINADATTPETMLVLGGRSIPTRATDTKGQLLAVLDGTHPPPDLGRVLKAYLSDGARVSREVQLTAGPPVLLKVSPDSTQTGQPFGLQPDGTSALSVDCEGAAPGTQVVFDSVPLPTTYGNDRWLTASVPSDLLRAPGHHTIALHNVFGDSNQVAFEITN